jgi:hypothetical protein
MDLTLSGFYSVPTMGWFRKSQIIEHCCKIIHAYNPKLIEIHDKIYTNVYKCFKYKLGKLRY